VSRSLAGIAAPDIDGNIPPGGQPTAVPDLVTAGGSCDAPAVAARWATFHLPDGERDAAETPPTRELPDLAGLADVLDDLVAE